MAFTASYKVKQRVVRFLNWGVPPWPQRDMYNAVSMTIAEYWSITVKQNNRETPDWIPLLLHKPGQRNSFDTLISYATTTILEKMVPTLSHMEIGLF